MQKRSNTISPKEEPEILIVEVYLKSRKFEGKIQIPLDESSPQAKRAFIESWLQMIEMGLQMRKETKIWVAKFT